MTLPDAKHVKLAAEYLSNAVLRGRFFMVIAADIHGIVTFYNAAAEKELGYSADEVVGKKPGLIWHDAGEVRRYAAELSAELGMPIEPGPEIFLVKARRGEAEEKEWTYIRKDGSRFPGLCSIDSLRDENGAIIGFLAMIKDISMRKSQQRTLVERDILLGNIISNIADALMTTDRRGVIQSYNPACEHLFGYAACEVIGQYISTLIVTPDYGGDQSYLAYYLEKDADKSQASPPEIQGRRKDGTLFSLELSVSRFESNGEVMFASIMRDVSERHRIRAEREQMIEQLTQSNTEFERFAYIASHDMQEPLRAMSSFSDILSTDYGQTLDDDGKLYLRLIRDAASRMQTMVVDLLEYARVGKDSASFEMFDGAAEYAQVLRSLISSIEGSDARIQADPLPQLKGLPLQFSRLLQNLIGNGLKYRNTEKTLTIRLRVDDKEDHWLFSVADNGIGIEEEHVAAIFEPFKRLHNRQKYAGTGLGLSVCKKIVEHHGGKIWCASMPGEGSTFFFTWPK